MRLCPACRAAVHEPSPVTYLYLVLLFYASLRARADRLTPPPREKAKKGGLSPASQPSRPAIRPRLGRPGIRPLDPGREDCSDGMGPGHVHHPTPGSRLKGLSLRFAWPSAAGVASSVCWRLSPPSPLQSTRHLPALPIPNSSLPFLPACLLSPAPC